MLEFFSLFLNFPNFLPWEKIFFSGSLYLCYLHYALFSQFCPFFIFDRSNMLKVGVSKMETRGEKIVRNVNRKFSRTDGHKPSAGRTHSLSRLLNGQFCSKPRHCGISHRLGQRECFLKASQERKQFTYKESRIRVAVDFSSVRQKTAEKYLQLLRERDLPSALYPGQNSIRCEDSIKILSGMEGLKKFVIHVPF